MTDEMQEEANPVLDRETQRLLFGGKDPSVGLREALSGKATLDDLVQEPLTDIDIINERLDAIGELVNDAELRAVIGHAVAGLSLRYKSLYHALEALAGRGGFDIEIYAAHIRNFVGQAADVAKKFPKSIGMEAYETRTIGSFATAFDSFFSSPNGAQVWDFFSYMVQENEKITALEQGFEKKREQERAMVKWVLDSLDIKRLVGYAQVLSQLEALGSMIYPYHALAVEAVQHHYVRPEIAPKEENCLIVEGGRWHNDSVPNNTFLDSSTRVEVIEGVNNGGKTYDLRKTLSIAVRALSGSWVPAATARVSIRDKIIMRLKGTGSTISALQQDCRNSNEAVPDGGYWLVAMDETFRSTEARGGEALTAGLISTIGGIDSVVAQGRSLLIISSHYPGLSEAYKGNSVVSFTHFGFERVPDEKSAGGFRLVFPHQKRPGPMTDYSYATAVAASSGFNPAVIDYAKQWLGRSQPKQ